MFRRFLKVLTFPLFVGVSIPVMIVSYIVEGDVIVFFRYLEWIDEG